MVPLESSLMRTQKSACCRHAYFWMAHCCRRNAGIWCSTARLSIWAEMKILTVLRKFETKLPGPKNPKAKSWPIAEPSRTAFTERLWNAVITSRHKMEMKYSDKGTLVQRQRYPLVHCSTVRWTIAYGTQLHGVQCLKSLEWNNIFDNCFVKAGACFIGSKKSKKKFPHKSTVNIFKNMLTKFQRPIRSI